MSEFDGPNVEYALSGGDGAYGTATGWASEVDSGNSVTLTGIVRDETVRVVSNDPRKGDQSQVLCEWSGPDA